MTGAGHQATLVFKQSMTYFEPLYERLKRRQLDDELKVGLAAHGPCYSTVAGTVACGTGTVI